MQKRATEHHWLGPPTFAERVALLAALISIVALSIDAMLPALDEIAADLPIAGKNSQQLVISALIVGLSAGQLIAGPLSDSFGRRPVIVTGLVIFLLGSLVSLMADDFGTLLIGRCLQGLGAAGPRVVTIAVVRDQFEGRAMARVLSFVMTVFIAVPALAPALGQTVLWIGSWRTIFAVLLAFAALALLWFWFRQGETLSADKRLPLRLSRIISSFAECIRHPVSLCYIVVAGFVFGSFVGYLTSVQQIFTEIYCAGEWFALYFGVLALALGTASVINARFVMQVGMGRMTVGALVVLVALTIAGLSVVLWSDGAPDLPLFMALMFPTFFCLGLVFGNVNALAMEPMGHIAGSAAAVIAALNGLIAVTIGTFIGQSFDGTVVPVFLGFAIAAVGSLVVIAVYDFATGSRGPADA